MNRPVLLFSLVFGVLVEAQVAVATPAAPATAPTSVASPAPATSTFTRELGRGLVYYRVLALPGDLPAIEAGRQRPTVLDVRYVHGDAAAGAALLAWLKFNATIHTPIFVLANTETSTPVLRALADRGPRGNVLVIGIPARDFSPDIAIPASGESEKRAYDALASGADVMSLLSENQDKTRNDEASLSRDRSTEPGADVAKDRPPPPPVDAALQRALHLHRALVALRKL